MQTTTQYYKTIVCCLAVLLLSAACQKDTQYEVLVGQLTGFVKLFDNTGQKVEDNSGIEVVADGGIFQVTTTTDETGRFVFSDLNSGTYNIIIRKDGFYEYRLVSYPFVGGNESAVLRWTPLFQQDNISISNLKITPVAGHGDFPFEVTATVVNEDAGNASSFRYYISNSPGVSYKNYIFTGTVSANPGEDLQFWTLAYREKFPAGSELYLIMYPCTTSNAQYYIDLESGSKIYFNTNFDRPSAVISGVVL